MTESSGAGYAGDAAARASAPTKRLSDEAKTELLNVRESEVRQFSIRMGRLCGKPSRSRWLAGSATLLLGGGIGGAFGLIPFIGSSPPPDATAKAIYFGALVLTFLVASVCALAGSLMRRERVEVIEDLKEDYDNWLDAYEE